MKNISDEEVNMLRRNARSVVRELGLLNDAYFDIGVTLAERHLLIELNELSYPTIGEIGEKLLLDKSTASRLIAKAVKKGYVKYETDASDKRKRYLLITEKGKKVMNAFEPIAFNQTRDALLTLTPEEVDTVFRGIDLYSKGLKHSRLRSQLSIEKMTSQDSVGIAQIFKESLDLFKVYQKKGNVYFVMKMGSKIIGGGGLSPLESEKGSCEIGNMCLVDEWLDSGLEEVFIATCLKEAKKFGYHKCFVEASSRYPAEIFLKCGFEKYKNNKTRELLWKACQ